jgi:hypothetical protein
LGRQSVGAGISLGFFRGIRSVNFGYQLFERQKIDHKGLSRTWVLLIFAPSRVSRDSWKEDLPPIVSNLLNGGAFLLAGLRLEYCQRLLCKTFTNSSSKFEIVAISFGLSRGCLCLANSNRDGR